MSCNFIGQVIQHPRNTCTNTCCKPKPAFFSQRDITSDDFIPGRIATINVGVTPSGMAINGNYLYVVNNNNYSLAGQDTISVIDVYTNLVVATISDPSFIQMYSITINPAGTLAYVTNSTGSTVSIVSLATNKVVGLITGLDGPSGFVIDSATNTGYVNNYGATTGIFLGSISGTILTVTAVETGVISPGMQITSNGSFLGSISGTTLTATQLLSGAINVGSLLTGIGITVGTTITAFVNGLTGGPGTYTVNNSQTIGSISMLAIALNQVEGGTVITGFGTASSSSGVGTWTVNNSQLTASTLMGAMNPGVQSGNGNTVVPVNLNNNVLGSPITVGQAPAALAITSDNSAVYVANYIDGNPNDATITRIMTSNNSTSTIRPFNPGLAGSFDIVLSPDGTTAYVSNFGSNNFSPFGTTVAIVDLVTDTLTALIPVGIQPSGLALSGRYLYVSNYNTLYTSNTFSSLAYGRNCKYY